jgi:hypothetical protein
MSASVNPCGRQNPQMRRIISKASSSPLRETYSFDHLVDCAADTCNFDVGHGTKYAPVRHAPLAARMSVTQPFSQANVREPFFPL